MTGLITKKGLLGVFILAASTAGAMASPNCTLPYNLQNGQTADASQVMADLNAIIGPGCVGSAASAGANSDITSLNGLTAPLPTPGGFINKFRNGTMDIWQRGTSSLPTTVSTGSYTADGWIAYPTGSADTCARGSTPYTGGPLYSLQCSGATGNTDTRIGQRIESNLATLLAGQTVTVQFYYQQNTGTSVTPNLATCYAKTLDTWNGTSGSYCGNNGTYATVDLGSQQLTSCASGTWCKEAYTFTVSPNASAGYEVDFDCNAALTAAQSCSVAAADIRVTPGATTGINTNPPPPEFRPLVIETSVCQRYFVEWAANGTDYLLFAPGFAFSSTEGIGNLFFPVPMRATPNMSTSAANTFRLVTTAAYQGSSISLANITSYNANVLLTVGSMTAGQGGYIGDYGNGTAWIQASAEL